MPLDSAHATEIIYKHILESGKLLSPNIMDFVAGDIYRSRQDRDLPISDIRRQVNRVFTSLFINDKIKRIESAYPTLKEGYGKL